ncbi:MAG: choline ABC transporter permease subunit, partial [Candidatus Hydrogenedentes bacterium]|nr:choline ABC transporter permease subunit [Candidatus Hydrogenedentota bacterium]
MLEFPEFLSVPLAEWSDNIMDWILANWSAAFDAVGDVVLQLLLAIERSLLWLPWFVVVLVVGVAAWRAMRRWWAGLLMASFMVLIGSFHYGNIGYWDLAMQTLAIIITSVIISLALGIPAGILMARSN